MNLPASGTGLGHGEGRLLEREYGWRGAGGGSAGGIRDAYDIQTCHFGHQKPAATTRRVGGLLDHVAGTRRTTAPRLPSPKHASLRRPAPSLSRASSRSARPICPQHVQRRAHRPSRRTLAPIDHQRRRRCGQHRVGESLLRSAPVARKEVRICFKD